jgi:hypothetical protein
LSIAVTVVIGPHDGRAETVRFSYNCRVGDYKPFPVNSHTIVALPGVPINIQNTDTVGKRAAQSVPAPKAVEPLLERRIREAAVVTRL